MEIKGKIIRVLPLIQGVSKNGNAYAKQNYIIQTEEQYPQSLCFSVFGQDKINQFCIMEGQYRIVKFSVTAREVNDANGWRAFNEIRAWACELDATRVQPQQGGAYMQQPQQSHPQQGGAYMQQPQQSQPQQPQQGGAYTQQPQQPQPQQGGLFPPSALPPQSKPQIQNPYDEPPF